jgi:2-desacetyl-2-hydroxyethyl bacteriochlorophyllide A dehydrogenase
VRGDRDGALAEFVRVPAANLSVIPDAVEFAQAVLAEPATTALHALEAAQFRPGAPVAVVGTGTLGLIVAQIAIAAGSPVTAVGVDPVGLALAESAGAASVRPGEATASSFGAVIEASGASSGLLEAGRLAAIGGRIGLLGYPAEPNVPVDAAMLIVNGVTIEAVLGGIDRMGDALRLIERGVIETSTLIDSIHSHHEVPSLFSSLTSPRPRPKIIVDLSALPESKQQNSFGEM